MMRFKYNAFIATLKTSIAFIATVVVLLACRLSNANSHIRAGFHGFGIFDLSTPCTYDIPGVDMRAGRHPATHTHILSSYHLIQSFMSCLR
jgi:hypothetical protein